MASTQQPSAGNDLREQDLRPPRSLVQRLGGILGLFRIPLYFAIHYVLVYGFLALGALYICGFLLAVAKSTACASPLVKQVLPFCKVHIIPTNHAEFHELSNLQVMLEEIQEASAGGVTLPLLMKRGENAVREVAANVELSNLPSKSVPRTLFFISSI